ncbi:hypothetical protein A3F66_07070 [candidate division TM6 bacterium RIFCSPHIGHO2_12_FULL_32_22]|nr:MAG: hypothetical protein A3F66_07070 [candidate division TM6 bacterium RIFCSPHIGHO2_12_FULL_32_22]
MLKPFSSAESTKIKQVILSLFHQKSITNYKQLKTTCKMKKLDKLKKELEKIQIEINKVSFERKDTSYRRQKGYFGTIEAHTSDCIIVSVVARTKYLNTYICVEKSENILVEKLNAAKKAVEIERARIFRLEEQKWAKSSILKMQMFTEQQIREGFSNYSKKFFIGNNNIYACHPSYAHSDYNKFKAMPNTAKHRKIAETLNKKMIDAGFSF